MHVVHLSAVLACFDEENPDIGIFSKTSGHGRPTGASSTNDIIKGLCHVVYAVVQDTYFGSNKLLFSSSITGNYL
jgi:hypothetical protein